MSKTRGTSIRRLFSPGMQVRMLLLIVGMALVSLLDIVGVAAIVPLTTAMTGGDISSGLVGDFWRLVGAPERDGFLYIAAGLVVVAFVLKALFSIAFRWWALGALAHQQVLTAAELMRRHLLAPYSMHRQRGLADLSNVLGTVVPQAFVALQGIIAVLAELFPLLTVAIAIIVIEPVMAFLVIVLLGVFGGAFQLFVRRRQRDLGALRIDLGQEANAAVYHAYGGVQEVKLRNNPDPFVDAYRQANVRAVQAGRVLNFLAELPKYVFEVLFVGCLALLAVVLFATRGDASALVSLAVFGVAGFRMLPSAVRLLASIGIVRASWPGVERLVEELDRLDRAEPEVQAPAGTETYDGDIRVGHVSFSYDNAVPVLEDVSFSIPAGSSVAFVGSSGAGKSTLVDLILGLQTPASGRIECGGVDIQRSIVDWQSRVGIVPQEVYLMDASLRRNIVFDEADHDIDELRVLEAVRRAQLGDLVTSHPDGLDLHVGDRGAKLSGGQRQRVGIARALYRQPSVLVLDEATSALDNETERRVTETIESLHGEVTVIVVAHRLSTVRGCDQFVVLSDGRVDACGTFEEVRSRSVVFARMVELATLDG